MITTLMQQIGRTVVNFSLQRFRQQNWFDTTHTSWQNRKRSRGSTRRDRGAIMVDSGRLRRSIRVISLGSYNVVVGSDVPYAKALNEGSHETVQVKAHSRQMTHKVVETYRTRNNNERSRTVRQASGTVAEVKAHSRKNNLPARTFLAASWALEREIEPQVAEFFLNQMRF